jgi:uncharacterized protein
MDREKLTDIARRAMAHRKPHPRRERGYIFHHGRRVGLLAEHLADRVEQAATLDRDILYVGGLFHDVGKGDEPHHRIGEAMVRDLLTGVLEAEQLEQVASLVAGHNRRGQADCTAAQKLIQDADILDHLGAQDIWLCIQYSAAADRGVAPTLEFYNSRDNRAYLAQCVEALNFQASRAEARRRQELERRFIDALADEEQGHLGS